MEIVDYLRLARRHLLVLAGVPILAAALAVLYIMANPRPYVATVDVSAPSLMGSQYGTYQGVAAAGQFPSDFVATATSPAVEEAVARQAHVSLGALQNGLSVQQVDVSSRVEITYTSRDPSTAGPVAAAVARQTLRTMFATQVPIAQAAVHSATATLHAANQALAGFAEKHGSLPVDQQYSTLTAQITALENEKAHDQSMGLTWSAGQLAGKIDKLRAKAATLAPLTGEHADLLAKQAAAASTLTMSQEVLAQAQAQLAAADPHQVRAPQAVEVPMVHLVVTSVLPAAAVGVFLAIVLVALLELIALRRPQRVRDHRPVLGASVRSVVETLRLRGMMAWDRLRPASGIPRRQGHPGKPSAAFPASEPIAHDELNAAE